MIFTQYYLDCLSQASYLIGDPTSGRAVVVDPRRDIDEYLADAEANGLRIELVIETHFHADFLSGHLELAEATGAAIGYGEAAEAEFPIRHLRDGERIDLGEVVLEVRATPGHTPESISIVVYEHADDEVPYGVLTGDTLFIGDVGRPDLLASVGVTAGELGSQLYDSLHTKLLTLPDVTRVFPAHGAGSACGKNLSTETQSTIGEQRRHNYALQPMERDVFVDAVTEGQPTAPAYFGYNARLNRLERPVLHEEDDVRRLSLAEVVAHRDAGGVVLDAREAADFARGHLRGSVNVGLGGRFAEYVGSVVRPDEDVVVITDPGTEQEARIRMARIGFDRFVGVLDDPYGSFIAHPEEVAVLSRLTAGQLKARLDDPALGVQVVDVRNPGEVALGRIDGSRAIPLPQLRDRLDELDATRPVVVHCAGGYRSAIAASLLEANGLPDVSDLLGGYGAWAAAVSQPA
jgi:glyoxylase-like metal-dependent hydrolase (beta-lactamase superfamily II)/rhodanese-related sulfurtransferase